MNQDHADSDPFTERLSDHLDDELAPDERAEVEAHLAGCASCRRVLAELSTLVEAARTLLERPPERDAWPVIEAALEPRRTRARPWALALAFAAGVLATLALVHAFGSRTDLGASHLLLLHQPVGFQADESTRLATVERYGNWLRELGARGASGEELEAAGTVFAPGGASESLTTVERIGGYFLLAARDESEALALAATCPHLEQGGRVELRRIRRD